MEPDKKVVWDPSMSVGERAIDEQHRRLIDQINRMIDVIASLDVDLGPLREAGHFLYTYIKEHFTYEEKYMADNKYPGLEGHRRVHQDFIKFYKDFQAELKSEMSSGHFSSIEVERFMQKIKRYLMDWLIRHIKGIDQEYARYIKGH